MQTYKSVFRRTITIEIAMVFHPDSSLFPYWEDATDNRTEDFEDYIEFARGSRYSCLILRE